MATGLVNTHIDRSIANLAVASVHEFTQTGMSCDCVQTGKTFLLRDTSETVILCFFIGGAHYIRVTSELGRERGSGSVYPGPVEGKSLWVVW